MAALWAHSLDTGAAAKAIAQMENAERKLADEAFVAGLLHDTGKLVLAANYVDQYGEVLKLMRNDSLEPCQAEQQVFGASHADVGGYLLGLWGLPVPVVEAIAFHHRPAGAPEKSMSPLTAVHAGNALVHQTGATTGNTAHSRLDTAYLSISDSPIASKFGAKAGKNSIQPNKQHEH